MTHAKRCLAIVALAATTLVVGCGTGLSGTGPTLPAPPAPSPTATPGASPTAPSLPDVLAGTWLGREEDFDSGETWETTYRFQPCIQRLAPWKKTKANEQCGEWAGRANIEGLPANCEATLSWLGMDGETFVFQAEGPSGSGKYGTYPHPYLEIDGQWYCWDTFRIRLAPDTARAYTVETIGAGSQSGAFVATAGTVTRAAGP